MPDSSVPINAPTTIGQSMAAFLDSGNLEHEKTIAEYIDTLTGDPQKVDNGTHPFPVSDAAAETALAAILVKLLASIAVTGTFWQATQPVSGTVTVDTSALATQATLALIKAKTDNIPALGQALAAASVPVTLTAAEEIILNALLTTSDFDTKTGSLTETAPATDTASSGLNGRLQRIAQRLTSLITALGSPFQAGGSIGNTTFAATQVTAANLNMTEASAAAILAKVTAAAASFVKLEDVASVDGDAGVGMLAVRKATPANTSGSDGDYEFLQMNGGKLWVQAGATQKVFYGTEVVGTVTNLQSLATSATAGWQGDRISNVVNLATDYEVFFKFTTANTAPGSTKTIQILICLFYTTDAGTTWFANSGGTATLPSGTQGTYTIAVPNDLLLARSLNYTTQQMVVQGSFFLSNVVGARMPDGWAPIVINDSGAALSTGCLFNYKPIYDTLV